LTTSGEFGEEFETKNHNDQNEHAPDENHSDQNEKRKTGGTESSTCEKRTVGYDDESGSYRIIGKLDAACKIVCSKTKDSIGYFERGAAEVRDLKIRCAQ
jgi:hypothetical protein